MAERIVLYTTQLQKRTAVLAAEIIGETQIHDNHITDSNGVFKSGKLVFDIIIDIPIVETPDEIELGNLKNKVRQKTATLGDLTRYLELRDGL